MMEEKFKQHCLRICGVLFFCLCLIFSLGCRKESSGLDGRQATVPTLNKRGYDIPAYASATAQLNYARTLVSKSDEKAAALQVFIDRFPNDREKNGAARLELAYMLLGNDFRLADTTACKQALVAYEAIAREFKTIPSVFTKALWYMGWIHTDLLHDKQRGVALYSTLAEQYPQYRFSRISPVPWLALVFPRSGAKPYTADDEQFHFWADLALFEIVKNSDQDEQKKAAFNKLWEMHPGSLAAGYALKEILRHSPSPQKMAPVVNAYIKLNKANRELNRDLTLLIRN